MRSPRILLGLVLGLAASVAAAQTSGALRWRAGAAPLGLQASPAEAGLQCGPLSLSCQTHVVVPLYTSTVAPRSLSMQLGAVDGGAALKLRGVTGLNVNFVGRAGLLPDLGVYGRVGTAIGRPGAFLASPTIEGMSYGVGLSWDFSRGASAVLGFDSYDVRTATGELRDVRATSLGLQLRY